MRPVNLQNVLIKIVKIIAGLVLLFLAVRQIDWKIFRISINNINPAMLLYAFISVLVGLAFKVWRWVFLLRNYGIKLPLYQVISAYFIGQAANIIMFVRGGEVLRIGWLHTKGNENLISITATIAFEKYLDLVMLVGVMIIVSPYLPTEAVNKLGQLRPLISRYFNIINGCNYTRTVVLGKN